MNELEDCLAVVSFQEPAILEGGLEVGVWEAAHVPIEFKLSELEASARANYMDELATEGKGITFAQNLGPVDAADELEHLLAEGVHAGNLEGGVSFFIIQFKNYAMSKCYSSY